MSSKPVESIGVSDLPDLLQVVERMRDDAKLRRLCRGDEALALITPIVLTAEPPVAGSNQRRHRMRRGVTQADIDAFWSAVGSWQDNVDVDRFLKDNRESRRISSRAAVEL